MFEIPDDDKNSPPLATFSNTPTYLGKYFKKSHFTLNPQPQEEPIATPQVYISNTEVNLLVKNLVYSGCSYYSRYVYNYVTNLANCRRTDVIDRAVLENLTTLSQLITDKYGNYLMQLLIKHSSPDVFKQIICLVENNIKEFSFNSFSCRVVQAVTERCIQLNIAYFVSRVFDVLICDLSQTVYTLNSYYASHIILLTLNYLDYSYYQKMFEFIGYKFLVIAENQYGCRILEKIYMLVNSDASAGYVQPLFYQLEHHCVKLSDNLYGNYLVQAVLKNQFYYENKLIDGILVMLINHFTSLCKSKYGSNICERVVSLCDIYMLVYLIEKCDFEELIYDQFGNFVTQMFIKRFSDFSKQCPCQRCNQDESVEVSQEIVIDENGNQIVVYKEFICILELFKAFCGFIKSVLRSVPSNHVQNCINESLDFNQLEELEFDDFLKLVQ